MQKELSGIIIITLFVATAIPAIGTMNIPNDQYFSTEQYSLHNTGQTGGIPDCDIDAPEAWDMETGNSDIVIAFLDSGIDYTHPDLAGKIWNNIDEIPDNGIDDDGNGYIDDIRGWDFYDNDNDPLDQNGHGTICAGIAAAVTNNGIGIAGVCWDCQIMPLKVNGLYNTEDIPALWIDAIEYAVDNGANIISMSLGIEYYHQQLENAVNYAYNNGVFLTASAGNQGWSQKHYPAAYDNVIGVAATNDEDKRMENAGQWSASSNYGSWVDVAAPGEDIFSTMPTYHVTFNDYGFNYDYMGYLCGTSCSAPHVAGLAGLLLSSNSSLTPDELEIIICGTADPYNSTYDLGSGRINAHNATLAHIEHYCQEMQSNWNLITIPVNTLHNASTLSEEITGCISISFWDAQNQTYQTYIVGGPPVFDFPIKDGRGYFVDMNQSSNCSLGGLEIDSVNVTMRIGWNLIGWYKDNNTTANSLADNITGSLSVSKWDSVNQTYQTYIVGGPPVFDFEITKGMGIFVDVSTPSYWYGNG
jgi:hypothetical protein